MTKHASHAPYAEQGDGPFGLAVQEYEAMPAGLGLDFHRQEPMREDVGLDLLRQLCIGRFKWPEINRWVIPARVAIPQGIADLVPARVSAIEMPFLAGTVRGGGIEIRRPQQPALGQDGSRLL